MNFEDRPADTTPRAWEAYNALIRAMSPEEKLIRVFELSAELRAWVEAGVRLQHPNASDREIQLRAAARNMEHQTFVRAFGWDPDSDEPLGDGI